MMARTVLFGGTFDPIHNGHLEIARAAAARFDLRKVLFVPAANPPHKTSGAQASYEDRIRMVELAIAGEAGFEVSRVEEGSAQSYSIHGVETGKAERGDLARLRRADALAEIQTWFGCEQLRRGGEFLVAQRP